VAGASLVRQQKRRREIAPKTALTHRFRAHENEPPATRIGGVSLHGGFMRLSLNILRRLTSPGFARSFRRSLAIATAFTLAVPAVAPEALAQDDDDEGFIEDEPVEPANPKRGGTPPPDTKEPSKTLQRAIKFYKDNKHHEATIELAKVLKGETDDEAAKKQLAEFFMGKALYKLGYYAGALTYFERIVKQSTGHRYYSATLKWLAALARVLPETSGILDKIGQYDPSDLEQPVLSDVRDELYYLLGRHFYRQGRQEDWEQAITLFQSVPRDSRWFIDAKFFEAVTYVRQLKGKPATDALKEILTIGAEKPKQYDKDDIARFNELAEMTMARIFYTTKQFDTSIRYYEKLPQASPEWLNSLFEASWAYFMKTNYSKALGNIHTLNAPYFEDQFFPESILLKSVMYYFYCQYDRAEEAVVEYQEKYSPLIKDLKEILAKYEDNADFYEYVTKILDNKAGLPDATQRLVISVLTDRTVAKTLNWVEELLREEEMVGKAPGGWKDTNIGTEVLRDLELLRSFAEADAGKLTRGRITRLLRELTEFNRDGLKVLIEIDERRAGKVMAKATGGGKKAREREEPIVVDDEHFMWKFDGEYWKDELGFYRFKVRSTCAPGGKPAVAPPADQ
jgi:tetratricopeptide (TPR) repeat protein